MFCHYISHVKCIALDEKNPSLKTMIRGKLVDYITRAEKLKTVSLAFMLVVVID